MHTPRGLKPCEKENLFRLARKAGFTDEGLRYMLTILNIPSRMTYDQYTNVLQYLNKRNSAKFNALV